MNVATYVNARDIGTPDAAWRLQMSQTSDYIQAYVDKGRARSHPRPPCDWCGTVRRGISARRCRVCAACNAAHYCCWQCQDAAWAGGHWSACGPATKLCATDVDTYTCRIVEEEA